MFNTECTRSVWKGSLKRVALSEKTKKSYFHRSLYIYNLLPYNLRIIEPKKFNKLIKEYKRTNFSPDRVPFIQ